MSVGGRTVIVTGASTGIGLAAARRFGAAGDRLVITARSQDDLERALADLRGDGIDAIAVAGSVADPDHAKAAVGQAVDKYGSVDVLINNAGIGDEAPILEMEESTWDNLYATNVKGPFLMTQQAARQMAEQEAGGVVLFTSSINACISVPPAVAYASTKAALDNLVKGLAVELAPMEIRVCGVSPGYIDTPSLSKASGDPDDPSVLEEWIAQRVARLPARRLGKPEEIAAAFFFLASEEADYITGANLLVDGGRVAAG